MPQRSAPAGSCTGAGSRDLRRRRSPFSLRPRRSAQPAGAHRNPRPRCDPSTPRTNGIAFLAGFLLGTADRHRRPGPRPGRHRSTRVSRHHQGAGGVAPRHRTVDHGTPGTSLTSHPWRKRVRGGAILAGLHHVGSGATLSMAGLLGFGGPKRLVLTLLAMASISEVDLGALEGPRADRSLHRHRHGARLVAWHRRRRREACCLPHG